MLRFHWSSLPHFWLLFVFTAALGLSGCAHAPRTSLPGATMPPVAMGVPLTHFVERGQTLYRIAKMYRVDVSDLMRANHIYSPSQLSAGQKLLIPQPMAVPKPMPILAEPVSMAQMEALVGPRRHVYDWYTITVHHSGTLTGSGRLFDKDHRRRKMGGLFYHFVIGNGSKTPDGSMEIGWRWQKQVKANRPNDIQICLVGDFNKQNVSSRQMSSLVNLIAVLRRQYGIPMSQVRRHCDIPGKHTDCPGHRFPFSELLQKLSER